MVAIVVVLTIGISLNVLYEKNLSNVDYDSHVTKKTVEKNIASFSWDLIVNDSTHSWNGQQEVKKKFLPDNMHLPLRYDDVNDYPMRIIEYYALDAALWMYLMTGDQNYLQKAQLMAYNVESLSNEKNLVLLNIPDGTIDSTTNRFAMLLVSKLALFSDEVYSIPQLADSFLQYQIDTNTNLIYETVFHDGTTANSQMDFPWAGDVAMESLLKSYEATHDEKYLNKAKDVILAYWSIRDKDTNLLPSRVDAIDGTVTLEYMQQYSAGAFLKILLHYYYLTDDPEILNIIDVYSNSIAEHVWDGTTWNYRTNYDGTVRSNIIEANFAKLDDALFLVYDLDPTKYQHLYDLAKMDYDNSFQSGLVLTDNGLVAHGIQDNGAKSSSESRLSYAFQSVQNPAYRLYHDTQDISYVENVKSFYDDIIEHHKREYGYVHGIDAYTLGADNFHSEIYALMPGAIGNKLILTVLPSSDVEITWTIIGNHKLSVPFYATFYGTGYFNAVHFDYSKKEITLDYVKGQGTIQFERTIKNVLLDGKKYDFFEDNTLNTISGEHRYIVTLV